MAAHGHARAGLGPAPTQRQTRFRILRRGGCPHSPADCAHPLVPLWLLSGPPERNSPPGRRNPLRQTKPLYHRPLIRLAFGQPPSPIPSVASRHLPLIRGVGPQGEGLRAAGGEIPCDLKISSPANPVSAPPADSELRWGTKCSHRSSAAC